MLKEDTYFSRIKRTGEKPLRIIIDGFGIPKGIAIGRKLLIYSISEEYWLYGIDAIRPKIRAVIAGSEMDCIIIGNNSIV